MRGPELEIPREVAGFLDLVVYHRTAYNEKSARGRIIGIRCSDDDEISRGFGTYQILVKWDMGNTVWVPCTNLSPAPALEQLANIARLMVRGSG